MGKSIISYGLVSVLLLSVLWKPAQSEDKCSIGCKGSSSDPSFLSGHKYNYAVEGVVSVYLTGADKQETSVKLLGQVSVSALGNCAHVLKVQNLVISGPDGKKYSKPAGLEKPVRFTLQDGKAGPELCAEAGDSRRSLNIKRAIITLLQSGQKSGTETDVFGICPTDATSSKEGGAVLLHRSRDLSRCGLREHGKNDLISAVYNPAAEIRNTQVLQSSLNVESKLNNGVPEKVSAIEEHLYKPFSVGQNGARAKVMTKLTLTGQAAGADSGDFKEVRSIIFENPHGLTLESSNYAAALAAVKDTAATLDKEASSKSAGNFAQLVRILRPSTKVDLAKLYDAVKDNSLERRVFLDGVIRAGTGESIALLVQLLKENKLNAIEQKVVLLTLGNAHHVDEDGVKAAASLLELKTLPKEAYIGIGAIAGTFCRSHNCHGGKYPAVTALSNALAAKLGNCKPKGKVEEDYVVAALKAIRNIYHLEDSIIDKLAHCVNDNGVKARVRVYALESILADPCTAKLHKAAMDLMKNRQLDSEIRIKAYLAVIACPCGKSATEIKTLLDSEPVHQVGRFISSSLRHIRASTNPDKRNARAHYGQIRTPNKFNSDDRKYSFYREVSYNVDALGLGGSVESSVIYSQDSFLPRSANLNLTAEVFGHSLNVFEIGGRQGNLDLVVEHLLGPKGVLRTKDPQKAYDAIVAYLSGAEKKVESKIRGRRSVKTDIDNFDKHVKSEAEPYDNELDMDIYVKLFGTDAIFLSFGDDQGFNVDRVFDQLLKYLETGINHAKKFQQDIRANVLFLDAELAYATSTGLPLKLNLIGSATGRLEVSTNVDIRSIIKDPKNAKVDFKLVPSTDVEISGQFLIDADAVATGLKVVTNLHSSTGTHVTAKVLENGQGFDLQLGLPVDKQEIVTASNDLIFFTREKGQKDKDIPIKVDIDRKEYSACFDQLSGVLGLTLCGEVSVPFSVSGPEAQASLQKFIARYPLTGSSKVKLVLEKNDLRAYHIKGVVKTDQPNKKSFELLFEAQGSKNRKTAVSGEYVNTPEEKSISLALDSPIKVLHGQVSLLTKPSEYVAIVKAKMDQEEYFGKAGFNVQGNDQRKVFKPILEYQLPGGQGKKNLKIDGQVIKEEKGPATKYSLEGIKVNLPSNEVVDVNGHITTQPGGFDADVKAKKADHNMFVSASVKDHDAKIEFQNTLNPYINFKVNAHSDFQKGNIRNDIELFYGGDLKNQKSRVTLNQLLKNHHNSREDFGLITRNKFVIHELPFIAEFNAEVDPKRVQVQVDGQYIDKKAKFDLDARTMIKKAGDYSVKVEALVDGKGVEAFAKRDIVSADKSNFENTLSVKNIGKYELSGVVLHKTKPHDVHVGAVGHLKVSGGGGKNEDVKFDLGLIENNNLYSSHAKVSRGKVDYLDFLVKVNRGNNPNGQLKVILKDTIAANGQFKVTDADGKGNGVVIVDFKRSGRKIKGDVKFLVKDPIYNADVDLFLNFEKDNADKVHVSTNSKRTEKLIESKNKFEYAGKKFEVNLNRKEEAGKTNANLEVVLPNERVLSYTANFNINQESSTQGEFTLSDAEKRGATPSTITYKTKMSMTKGKEDVKHEGQLSIKLKDGRNLEHTSYFKSEGQGGNKGTVEFKTDVTGSLIPKPATLTVNLEGSDDKQGISGLAKYRVKGSYGDDYSIEMVGSEEVSLNDKADKKYQTDNTIQVRLPFESAHNIKVISNVLFILPKGSGVEYTVVNSVQLNSDNYKLDASGKFGPNTGFSKVKVLIPHVDPFSMDVSYKADLEGEKKTAAVEMKSSYGKGKTATLAVDASSLAGDHRLNVKANAPQAEKLKKLEISVHTKKPTSDSYNTAVIVDADGRVYKSDVQIVYSRADPAVDFKYSSPSSPKPTSILVKGHSLNSNQGRVEVKIENLRDFSFDGTAERIIQKDNLHLKLNLNSEKFNLKGYKLEIASKDSGSGKRLEFSAVNDGKNILSGSTSYISKQEGQKSIVEGSGSVKVKEEEKSANFKYIRTMLTEGPEQGIETFMNVAIGERSYVAESRVTNLEYKTSYVYCEEKKQCAHAELHSKLNVQKPGTFQHTVNVGLDLRKLGFAPEFGLQMNNEVSEHKLPQYALDVHMNKEDKKYHLHVYSTPEHGKFPSGITVTLPSRVLALESELSYPTNKGLPFPIKAEVTLNLDKNKPQLKSSARVLVDVTGSEKQHNAIAEFAFSHPKLGKESLIKVRGSLQRPTDNSFKIESGTTVSIPSIGADRNCKFLVEGSPSSVKVFLETPIVKIIDLEGSASVKDSQQQADLKFSLLEGKMVQVRALTKDYQYFEFSTGYADEAQRKLSVTGHIDPEKRVDISADIVLPNEKKNIIHGALFIQDNLVKSDYGISKDNFNYFISALKNDLSTLKDRIKKIGEKTSEEFKATLQKVEPKFKQLEKAYREEAEKLVGELTNDQVLKNISRGLNDIVQFLAGIAKDLMDATKPLVDMISQTMSESCKKIQDMYEKQIEPELKKLYANAAAIIKEYFNGLIDVVAHFAAIVTDFFEKHKAELEELTNTLAEIFKDLTRLVVAQLKEWRTAASQYFAALTQQIKELPIFAMIEEKFKDSGLPRSILNLVSDGYQAIRSVLPTEELKALFDAIFAYANKKVDQEKLDDSKELRSIYEKLAVAVTSLVNFFRQQLNQLGFQPSAVNISLLPSIFTAPHNSAPALGGVPSLSLLNQLITGDLPDPLALLRAYRPRSLNPLDEIPSKLRAVVVNGQHIFTFDGRHLTFPGSCRYVLAHDYVDRNFTLAIQLQAGAPKSLILEDKTGTTIELRENGQVAVNGAAHGFPVLEKDSFAWREPTGLIGLATSYGLLVRCSAKLQVCYVEASGFYLGKLRGLLGDGNNEPFDDFRLPNGKIVSSEAEFGNAYRLSSSCAQVQTPEHSDHQHHAALPAACEQVFGSSSPLRPLALVLDVTPFRQACIHAVTASPADALTQACDLGRAYTALAVTGLLPAALPPACLTCNDADKPRKLGEVYQVNVPGKKADVVVIVETTQSNEKTYKDLVVPLVGQLVDQLKAKKLDDIKVYLVGITSRMRYPILYDTDNKLKNAKITFPDASRYEKTPVIKTGVEKIDAYEDTLASIVDELRVRLGLTNIMGGYSSLFDLPLRADAVKHSLTVIGEPCKGQSIQAILFRAFATKSFENNAHTQALITPTPELKVAAGADPKNVIGFGSDNVLVLGDKKRGHDSEAIRQTLEVRDDICVDFIQASKNGLVFSSSTFEGLNPGQQKQYLHSAAAALVERMTKDTLVQACTCQYVDPFRVRSVCINKERKETARRRK